MKNQLILGDNLEVLKDIPSESVDLCYIDPPFFSNRHYAIIWGDKGEIASFNDCWAGGINHYIEWLYKRVEQIYRVLKPTGSFYLHCDWHANAYIRVHILDKIFGDKNFVNEIVWHYDGPQSPSPVKFANKHDTIFRYSKGRKCSVNELYFYEQENFSPKKYKIDNQGNFYYTIPKGDYTESSIKRLDQEGKIIWTANGKARIKKIIEVSSDKTKMLKRKKIPDVWKIPSLGLASHSKERIGYPTQKPEALLERIIKASSNPGDVVLDAFCGGGTTPAVARRLGRKFIGIDQSVRAIAVSNARLEKQTDLLINDIYEVRTKAYDYDKLRNMDPFKFESLMVELYGGIPNTKKHGDGGKDGVKKIDGETFPIQVKQMDNVGQPLIQNFIGHLMQNKQKKGFFIAFDFTKTAYECVAEVKQSSGIEIELVKVESFIPLVRKTPIKLDWSYETVDGKQVVTLVASGDDISLWQWDFDYDESRGFVAEIFQDKTGTQKISLTAGKHVIAVRGTDSNGIESTETITLYSNGSVHE